MYKHILIATDGSELAGKAVNAGLQLAKALNAKVTAVTVTEPWAVYITGEAAIAYPLDEYEKSAAENAAQALAAADELAKKNCRRLQTDTRERSTPDRRNPRHCQGAWM